MDHSGLGQVEASRFEWWLKMNNGRLEDVRKEKSYSQIRI